MPRNYAIALDASTVVSIAMPLRGEWSANTRMNGRKVKVTREGVRFRVAVFWHEDDLLAYRSGPKMMHRTALIAAAYFLARGDVPY